MDDIWVRRKETVGLDLLERLRDGLFPERTSDLLERVESLTGGIDDEVHVRESALRKSEPSISQ